MNHNEIIKYPLLTEKSYKTMAQNVYVFAVDRRARKIEIKDAIEFIFEVKVEKINLFNVPQKEKKVGRFKGLTNSYKKAYVYLREGKINIFPEEIEKEQKVEKQLIKEKSTSELKLEEKIAAKIAAKEQSEIKDEIVKSVPKKVTSIKKEITSKEVTPIKKTTSVKKETSPKEITSVKKTTTKEKDKTLVVAKKATIDTKVKSTTTKKTTTKKV
ncbi:50S ribosomal protein L23 [[Mycoplasma] mobile]|uniref:Large ribosomal subunit protein uL23 n=1 Tax=Mycoplasma mobile (strain ATCC 43663 / 163K / NCTC 11711) TaxID=267748 RepID=RL23_MYCM1|nr:50S ribosomal protein L23 [[Mycoplasma] mobile]Q6KI53.1 RecName: Full=Large ribosomal subunit protein uL23; AltName: Full=50S ribosomal protein L23 [Mycoplasma mobile 163K]AAT27723.1 50S ribosomal protein l23 [Mycoplasma mobile 163K]